MNQKTKNHKKWEKELNKYLENIQWCEICGTSMFLTKAHRVKRRFIKSREEYLMAIRACVKCHQDLDEGKREDPHRYMFYKITNVIKNRSNYLINGEPVFNIQSYEEVKNENNQI